MKLKTLLLSGLALIASFFSGSTFAQLGESEFLPPDQAFRVEVAAQGADMIRVDFLVTPGYYLYRHRFNFSLDTAAGTPNATLGSPDIPEGEWKEDEFFGRQQVFHEGVSVSIPVSRTPGGVLELPIIVGLQGCADKGLCYPPEKRRFKVSLPATNSAIGGDLGDRSTDRESSASARAPSGSAQGFVSEQDRLAELIRTGHLSFVLLTFFGLGLLLAFTPCVLPMVPILSGIIAGQGSGVTTGRAFALSLSYVLGMAVMNTLAGVAAAAAGQQIQALFQQPWIIVLFSLIFVALALSMFGLFTIQLPASLQTRLSEVSNRQRAGTFGGVAVMGALSALIVSACVAPPLFAALAVIAQTGDMVRGGSALFVMSLGMGVPLLVIGTSAGRLLPKAGGWMDTVKKFFGVLMLAVAAWMLSRLVEDRGSLLLWAVPASIGAWLLLSEFKTRSITGWVMRGLGAVLGLYALALIAGVFLGGRDPLAPIPQLAKPEKTLQFTVIKTVDDLDRAIAAAAAEGRPAMLDFYADWCVSCKEMERYTFTDTAVQAALANAVLLKADVTANDEADQALLRRFEIFGPPTIAFWGPDGVERKNYRVVGFMKADEFARVAAEATGNSDTIK
ncbi:MAG: protein-disulfide reductase DsbD [Gammaproteobacteria bacterium]|nr:protein-disulfide reductase DsbD [Gammaproteobacteria bacterium]